MLAILVYALIVAVLAGIVGAVGAAMSENEGSPVWGFAVSFLIGGIGTIITLTQVQPSFSYIFDGGYSGLAMLAAGAGAIGAILCGKRGSTSIIISLGVLLIAFLIFVFPIPWMATSIKGWEAKNKMVNTLLPISGENQTVHIDPNSMVVVSPSYSYAQAKSAPPQAITSWASVENDGYLQGIGDEAFYVHGMTGNHNRWDEYNAAGGGVTPGYVRVNARDPKAVAQWVPLPVDKQLKLMPGAGWETGLDLEAWVYTHVELPQRVKVKDIRGLEVDPQDTVHIIGTLIKPSDVGGTAAEYPIGIVDINPTTMEYVIVPLAEIPAKYPWLDRIYPLDVMTNLVNWYGTHNNNTKGCWVLGISCPTEGKLKVDGEPYVFYDGGETYAQYVMTDLNAKNPVVAEILQVSLKTGKATRISFTDDNRSRTPADFLDEITAAATKANNKIDVKPVMLSMRSLAGANVWVAVLEEQVNGQGKFWGFAAYLPELTKNPSVDNVDVSKNLGDLEVRVNQRISLAASTNSGAGNVGGTPGQVQIDGVVGRKSDPTFVDGSWIVSFDVIATIDGKQQRLLFRIPADNMEVRYLHEGDEVKVTARTLSTTAEAEVLGIVNKTYPAGSTTPTPEAAPTAAPEATAAPAP